MANAGLSDGFVFAPKPPAAPAANIRVSVPPYNKDVFKSGNETVMFNVPSGKRGQYLNTRMSYMTFDVDVMVDSQAPAELPILALDGGAHAFFNSLEVYHGSNLLEQIREYNTLYQILQDSGEMPDCTVNGRSVTEGTQAKNVYGTVVEDAIRGGRLITPCIIGTEKLPMVTGADKYLSDSGQAGTNRSYNDTGYHCVAVPDYDDLFLTGAGMAGLLSTTNGNIEAGTFSGTTATAITVPATGLVSAADGQPVTGSATIGANTSIQLSLTSTNGVTITRATRGAILADNSHIVTYTFAIPLVSGILGVQMGKYIPVGSLAADIRLELGLAPFEQAFKTVAVYKKGGSTIHFDPKTIHDAASSKTLFGSSVSANTPYKVELKNFELQLEYIEVSSDVQMAIEASTGGQYVMSFDSYHDFQNTIPAGPGSITQLIGAKFSSIKTIYTAFRDQYQINNVCYPGVTSRVNPFSTLPNRPEYKHDAISTWSRRRYESGTGWQYMVGSTLYPPKPVQSDEESFMEYVKSNHMVANQNRQGLVDLTHWGISARRDESAQVAGVPTAWNQYCMTGGTFLMAQNFESQSHKSHLTESGINTLAQTMYMVARFPNKKKIGTDACYDQSTGVALCLTDKTGKANWEQTNQALQTDHFIHYDGILIISNGVCSTRF